MHRRTFLTAAAAAFVAPALPAAEPLVDVWAGISAGAPNVFKAATAAWTYDHLERADGRNVLAGITIANGKVYSQGRWFTEAEWASVEDIVVPRLHRLKSQVFPA